VAVYSIIELDVPSLRIEMVVQLQMPVVRMVDPCAHVACRIALARYRLKENSIYADIALIGLQ
jgi:hypothetical protein